MNLNEVSSTQRFDVVTVNENFETIDYSAVYGKKPSATEGLTWAYEGGRWSGFAVAEGTLTLTNGADNYIVVLRSTGAISVSTSSTNWNNVVLYARVYKLTVAGSVVTVEEDHRAGVNGVHGPAAGSALRGLTFTADTDSTADSDPGAGLFKWNNATQSSATVIYFDNQTADGISLTSLWTAMPASGVLFLQQADDTTKWQLWGWTAAPVDGTGYRKFTVSLLAFGAAIADAKQTFALFVFQPTGAYQPLDATLTALAGAATAANKMWYWTGTDAGALIDLTAQARSFLDDSTAAAQRSTLGLDTLTQPLMNYGGLAFNGSTTYLDSNALTGIADSKVGSLVFIVRAASTGANEELLQATGNGVRLLRGSTGNVTVQAENAAGASILSQTTTGTPMAAAGTYVIMVSWNLAVPGSIRIYVNDVSVAAGGGTYVDDTIDYTLSEYSIGSTATGGNFFSGDMYLVWFDPTSAQDFSSAAVRRKFADANNVPQYLGRNGELPTGTPPILFLGYDSAAQWPINRGSAQSTAFTQNGAIAAVGTVLYGQWAPLENRGTIKTVTADYTVLATDETIINNRAGTNALTLPDPTTCKNRKLNVLTIQAQAVNSASSNVVPRAGGAAGTAILGASDGAWAELQSDGTSWQIIKSS